ncbi:MAG: hypothetical protein WKG07_09520 [Hymenobacter sp.]
MAPVTLQSTAVAAALAGQRPALVSAAAARPSLARRCCPAARPLAGPVPPTSADAAILPGVIDPHVHLSERPVAHRVGGLRHRSARMPRWPAAYHAGGHAVELGARVTTSVKNLRLAGRHRRASCTPTWASGAASCPATPAEVGPLIGGRRAGFQGVFDALGHRRFPNATRPICGA